MPTIYFVVFDHSEVLDFSGAFDVFSMALIATRKEPYDLRVLSADGKMIRAIHEFKVVPDAALYDVTPGPADIIVVPGGTIDVIDAIEGVQTELPEAGFTGRVMAADQENLKAQCQAIVDWLAGPAQNAGMICTVCIGAFFGAKAGIFAGRQATTHHQLLDRLNDWIGSTSALPPDQRAEVLYGPRYAVNPDGAPLVVSSAGVSAGMDLAFYILGQVWNGDAVTKTERLMQYNGARNDAAPDLNVPDALKYDLLV